MADKQLRAEQIEDLAASKITSGTFADARIAESNVTQHEAALTVTAAQASFTPAGNIAATDVQAALEELDTEKEPADATILKEADVDDTPVNGATAVPVSSNWAYDHENSTAAHGATGAVVGTTNTQTLVNKTITAPKLTVSDLSTLGATETIDWSSADIFYGTLDSNVTITHSNEASGRTITIHLAYDATAQRTITWSDVDRWTDNDTGAAPTTPSASGDVLTVTMQYYGTTCVASATGNYSVYA